MNKFLVHEDEAYFSCLDLYCVFDNHLVRCAGLDRCR